MVFHNPKTDAIRAALGHPVIDSDGHLTEYMPVAREYLNKAGGSGMFDKMMAARNTTFLSSRWYDLDDKGRRDEWAKRPPFWGNPLRNKGLDLATSLFPDLMYKRLDEFGLDFTVLYPGFGIILQTVNDEEVRRAACRGFNEYYADLWMGHPDRMTPAAAIPMHTPQEAIEELEYAVKRGFKVVMMPSWIRRPIPAVARKYPDMERYAYYLDSFGIDSAYNYDPVWRKCEELKVIPSFHGPGEAFPFRNSISNAVYNHMGHFASAADALCRSLFLGGVPHRFPNLRFLFLEAGVGWARSLMADLTSHWEKKGMEGLYKNNDPKLLDQELFLSLYKTHGGKMVRDLPREELLAQFKGRPSDPTDNFAGLNIKSKKDIRDVFTRSFYFGCEGDDPLAASAFDAARNPGKVRLQAIYGSDISHWDVPEMTEILEEAHELLEDGLVTPDDFKEFVFGHPAKLWTTLNPDFYKGTVVESAVQKYLSKG